MGDEHKDFTGDIDVPEEAIQIIDVVLVSKLPPGTIPLSISPFGASFWTRTARLDTKQGDNSKSYFLKTSYRDRGKAMMFGEFTAMSAIKTAVPDLCPQPIAHGTYASNPDIHFFICDFHEMTDELPDLHSFPAKMAQLHRNGTSPNGKYGFPCTTFHGNTALQHGWADTWEEYFITRTKVLFDLEQEAQGPNHEILELCIPFFEKVVPRLLRPLETDGYGIRPSLIHGDLWHGNASTDADTGLSLIFDAGSFYAHNEYDLAVWRANWCKFGKSYINRYFKSFPIAAPEEDFEDRSLLYATRVNVCDSILYKGYSGYREVLIQDMRRLVDKYSDGYEGWAASHSTRQESMNQTLAASQLPHVDKPTSFNDQLDFIDQSADLLAHIGQVASTAGSDQEIPKMVMQGMDQTSANLPAHAEHRTSTLVDQILPDRESSHVDPQVTTQDTPQTVAVLAASALQPPHVAQPNHLHGSGNDSTHDDHLNHGEEPVQDKQFASVEQSTITEQPAQNKFSVQVEQPTTKDQPVPLTLLADAGQRGRAYQSESFEETAQPVKSKELVEEVATQLIEGVNLEQPAPPIQPALVERSVDHEDTPY